MIIAIGLAFWLLPQFNQLTGKSIAFELDWKMGAAITANTLVTGFIAGSYPAFYISGFSPTAVKAMNLKNPIGSTVKYYNRTMQVIGVVKDFHFESMHEPIKPLFMHLYHDEGSIVVRVKAENQKATLAAIEQLYQRYNPGFPSLVRLQNKNARYCGTFIALRRERD